MKGVIALTCGELARYSVFYDSLLNMDKPEGTEIIQSRGVIIAENRSILAEEAISRGCDWIFYVDDDQVFEKDTLTKLLARDVDIVSGLYLQKSPPFPPLYYEERYEDKGLKRSYLETSGMQKVVGVGAGCLLIKTKVFEKLDKPYFRFGSFGEDFDFCLRAAERGFDIWLDLETPVGHLATMTIWPMRDDEGWHTKITRGLDLIDIWPAAFRIKRRSQNNG